MVANLQNTRRDFHAGDRLGKYTVVGKLRDGVYSENLKVHDSRGTVFHAVVHREQLDQSRILLEGLRIQQALSHPCLAKIVDVPEPCHDSKDRTWFVRELLPPTPEDWVFATSNPRSVEEVLRIGYCLCDLFAYLQDQSQDNRVCKIHGFLLPGYIHLTNDGHVRVTGLDVQLLARIGVAIAPRHFVYRSPEEADAAVGALTPANDLWAIAALARTGG